MQSNYHFPFFGAGKDTYGNTMQLIVVFKIEPTENQQLKILEKAPQPIKTADWDKHWLNLNSGPFFNIDIEKNDQEVDTYNDDIERWLKEIDRIIPILMVFRHENAGTLFSDWHKWSLKQFELILPYFDDVVEAYEYDSTKAHVIFNILSKVELSSKLEKKYIKFLHPGEDEYEAFKKQNLQPLKNLPSLSYIKNTFKTFEKYLEQKHQKQIKEYAFRLLEAREELPKDVFNGLTLVFLSRLENTESKIFKRLAKHTDKKFATDTIRKAYNLILDQRYKQAINEYIKFVALPQDVNSVPNNYKTILWVFQQRNTGLPVDKSKNLLVLKKCIPMGVHFPHIYYDACCVYVEMEDYKSAYKMIEKALEHYIDCKSILKEISTLKMFKTFCERTNVLELLAKHQDEITINPKPRFISKIIAYNRFQIHNIFNSGLDIDSVKVLLLNGSVQIEGEFNEINRAYFDSVKKPYDKKIVIINGNLAADSITQHADEHILIMGKINCNKISHKNIIERGRTNFNYEPLHYKKNIMNNYEL